MQTVPHRVWVTARLPVGIGFACEAYNERRACCDSYTVHYITVNQLSILDRVVRWVLKMGFLSTIGRPRLLRMKTTWFWCLQTLLLVGSRVLAKSPCQNITNVRYSV